MAKLKNGVRQYASEETYENTHRGIDEAREAKRERRQERTGFRIDDHVM